MSRKAQPGKSQARVAMRNNSAVSRTGASRHSSHTLLGLQHLAGNQAVSRMLQETGPSQSLDLATRVSMEARLGHSFQGVRVYSNPAAAGLAKSLKAKAFTVGSDIGFGDGHYAPHTTKGKQLLTHELVHVAQQRGANASAQIDSDPAAEQEAANLSVETDLPNETTIKSRSAGIQRAPEDEEPSAAPKKGLEEFIAKYEGRLRSSGGALEETWRRAHDPTNDKLRRAAAAELGTIERYLKHGVDGRKPLVLEVVPPKGVRTADLRAHYVDGSVEEVEITAATAARQKGISKQGANEKERLKAREELATETQKRFAGPEDVRSAIWRKAKPGVAGKPSQFKQKGAVVVDLPFTRLKSGDIDKAVLSFDKAGKQLSPDVHRIEVSFPERAGSSAPLKRTTVVYVRTETGFKRESSSAEGSHEVQKPAPKPPGGASVPSDEEAKTPTVAAEPDQPVKQPLKDVAGEPADAEHIATVAKSSTKKASKSTTGQAHPDVDPKTKAPVEPEAKLEGGHPSKAGALSKVGPGAIQDLYHELLFWQSLLALKDWKEIKKRLDEKPTTLGKIATYEDFVAQATASVAGIVTRLQWVLSKLPQAEKAGSWVSQTLKFTNKLGPTVGHVAAFLQVAQSALVLADETASPESKHEALGNLSSTVAEYGGKWVFTRVAAGIGAEGAATASAAVAEGVPVIATSSVAAGAAAANVLALLVAWFYKGFSLIHEAHEAGRKQARDVNYIQSWADVVASALVSKEQALKPPGTGDLELDEQRAKGRREAFAMLSQLSKEEADEIGQKLVKQYGNVSNVKAALITELMESRGYKGFKFHSGGSGALQAVQGELTE